MKFLGYTLRDNYGWPIESVKGKHFYNFIRALIHTDIFKTLFHKSKNIKKFTITVEMQERWIPHFMSMLKYMESLGRLGSSREVTFYSDGDGDFRPRFNANIEFETQKPIKDDNGNRTYDAG